MQLQKGHLSSCGWRKGMHSGAFTERTQYFQVQCRKGKLPSEAAEMAFIQVQLKEGCSWNFIWELIGSSKMSPVSLFGSWGTCQRKSMLPSAATESACLQVQLQKGHANRCSCRKGMQTGIMQKGHLSKCGCMEFGWERGHRKPPPRGKQEWKVLCWSSGKQWDGSLCVCSPFQRAAAAFLG